MLKSLLVWTLTFFIGANLWAEEYCPEYTDAVKSLVEAIKGEDREKPPNSCKADVKRRMGNFNTGTYRKPCPAGGGCKKPEITKELGDFVYSKLKRVYNCLANANKLGQQSDPNCPNLTWCNFMAVVSRESGFIPNVVSPTGAAGLMQLTGPLLETLNDGTLDKQLRSVSCSDVKSVGKIPTKPADHCKRTDPDFVMSNIVYAAIHMNIMMNEANKLLKNYGNLDCSVRQMWMVWVHNAGQGNLKNALEIAARSRVTSDRPLSKSLAGLNERELADLMKPSINGSEHQEYYDRIQEEKQNNVKHCCQNGQ